jgi:hypothetical protein
MPLSYVLTRRLKIPSPIGLWMEVVSMLSILKEFSLRFIIYQGLRFARLLVCRPCDVDAGGTGVSISVATRSMDLEKSETSSRHGGKE